MAMLKKGLTGEPVRILQEKLGVEADGVFGPGTEEALKDYQKANGLVVDGIAGPDTFNQMGLFELILLRVGSRGHCVKKVQEELGIEADGIFGKGTEASVKSFQEQNALTADGVVGPATLAKMKSFDQVDETVIERSFLPAGFNIFKVPEAATQAIEDSVDEDLPLEVQAAVESAEAQEQSGGRKGIWGSVRSLFKRN